MTYSTNQYLSFIYLYGNYLTLSITDWHIGLVFYKRVKNLDDGWEEQ